MSLERLPSPVFMPANFSIASVIVESMDEDLFSNFSDCALIPESILSDWVVIFCMAFSVTDLFFSVVVSIIFIVLVMADKTSAIFCADVLARVMMEAVFASIVERI